MINLDRRNEKCFAVENGDRIVLVRHLLPFNAKQAKEMACMAGEIERNDTKNWTVREITDNKDLQQCYDRLEVQQQKRKEMGYGRA